MLVGVSRGRGRGRRRGRGRGDGRGGVSSRLGGRGCGSGGDYGCGDGSGGGLVVHRLLCSDDSGWRWFWSVPVDDVCRVCCLQRKSKRPIPNATHCECRVVADGNSVTDFSQYSSIRMYREPKGFRDAQQKAPWRGELAITGAGHLRANLRSVERLPHELGAFADGR